MATKVIQVHYKKMLNSPYVSSLYRDSAGKLTDVGTSIYPKSVDVEIKELEELYPQYEFTEIVGCHE